VIISGICPPDPYIVDLEVISGILEPGNNATVTLTPRTGAINTGIRNLVLFTCGQSLLCNTCPTVYIPVNFNAVDNLNIYDGAIYNVGTVGLLGCTNSIPAGTLGLGNLSARIADKLITNGRFDRVIIVPIGMGGSMISEWATGSVSNRFRVAMRRLAARGIVPGMTNVTFGQVWGLGETDAVFGTTAADYISRFGVYLSNCNAAGFVGYTFVNLETLIHNVTYPVIHNAQASLPNGVNIFVGGDLDTLTGPTNRQPTPDDTHLTDTGAASAASLIYNAMHAAGFPY